MTNPIRVEEASVFDGKNGTATVKSGDKVELLTTELRVKTSIDEEFFAQKSVDFLRGFLGPGPYTISWFGRWPCGRDMLYIKKEDGEPGCHASDFMSV